MEPITDKEILDFYPEGQVYNFIHHSLAIKAINLILKPSKNHYGKLAEIEAILKGMDEIKKGYFGKSNSG